MKTLLGALSALALCAAIAAPVNPAAAQDAEPFAGHESAAWAKAHEVMMKHVTEHVASKLTLIAYHGVAESLCEGVATDREKVKQAVDELHPENWEEMSDEDHTQWTNVFLVLYGTASGLLLAEHADHVEPFCAEVDEIVADKESDWNLFAAK